MTVARRGWWIGLVVVLLVEAELHLRVPLSAVLALGFLVVVCAGRWPLLCLVGVCFLLLSDALVGGVMMSQLITPLLAVAYVSFVAGGRAAPILLVLTSTVSAALLTAANQVADPGSFTTTNDGVFFALLVGTPALAGHLLEARSSQVAELGRLNDELDRRQEVVELAARATEVERVERAVDHALVGRLRTVIEGIRRADELTGLDPGSVPTVLAAVERTSRDGLSELRAVLGVLHSPIHERKVPHHDVRERKQPRMGHPKMAPDLVDLSLLLVVVPLAIETSTQTLPGTFWLNTFACWLQGVLLMTVRRVPIPGALCLIVVTGAQTAFLTPLPQSVGWFLPALVLAFLLGFHVPPGQRWWGLVLCGGTALAGQFCTPPAGRSLNGLAPALMALGLMWWVGVTVAVRQGRATELAARADELSRTSDVKVSLAAAQQRAEMARELHDVGAHALTVVCLQAIAAQTLWDRDRSQAVTALRILGELADGPLKHLGSSLGDLSLETTSSPLDVTALAFLTGFAKVLGLDVDVHVRGVPCPLSDDVARTAFRVLQESLTNAARHAPGTTVRVALAYDANGLEVLVQNSGPATSGTCVSVPLHGSGSGLRGMNERVEACRGELECGPDAGGGFHVLARLPVGAP